MSKYILMTGNSCLLDTSIIVQALRNNTMTGRQLDLLDKVYVPLTVVGELLYGAYKSAHLERHIQETESFLGRCTLLFPDKLTADFYGKIKAALMKKGKPVPENDIWIAAVAFQHSLPLFTSDTHFQEIDGLRLYNPLTSA